MIQFSRLRLNGFKSFVERTELDIGPGLNGIVGPNGCGKSNLVEAMRWVMGESSAKRMRGGGMEDVIFNGTAQRAPRNIAEVSVLLDNSARTAPAAYNNSDEIEIVRRIEKDHGSSYKINGKNARARDVQMLFADTVTGAGSPALVSQGQITKMINAKPLERRLILEESAGISGLYARRHEAELRLKAADTNLLRVEDIVGSMEKRFNDLKRQARQASRYRNVNAQIRQMELLITYLDWRALEEKQNQSKVRFNEAESEVAEKLVTVTQMTKTQNTQAQELPPLRQKEAELAASLQTQKLALQRIEDEEARLEQQLEEADAALKQTKFDHEHEQTTLKESAEQLERIQGEQENLIKEQDSHEDKLAEKLKIKDDLEEKVTALEAQYTAMMESAAESRAKQQSLEQQIEQNSRRLETIKNRKAQAQAELDGMEKDTEAAKRKSELENNISKLEDKVKAKDQEITNTQTAIQQAQQKVESDRAALTAIETKKSEFNAEIAMLESFFQGDDTDFNAVLDVVQADSGFEKALSRALGDSLMASLEEEAPSFWLKRNSVDGLPALPQGVTPLLPHIKAPEALHLALSQIGFVQNESDGQQLMQGLKPGQALVSAKGTYWRWDGYVVKSAATDRHSLHLEQKNKLKALEAKRPEIKEQAAKAQKTFEDALSAHKAAQETLETLQAEAKEANAELTQARTELAQLKEDTAKSESEISRLTDAITLADEDIKDLEQTIKTSQIQLDAITEAASEQQNDKTDEMRESLRETREAYQAAMRAFDMYQQEQNSRKARLHAIADERLNLQNRIIRAKERIKELETRQTTQQERFDMLRNQPKDSKKNAEALLTRISEIEKERAEAAEQLAIRENEVMETGKALKDAEQALGSAREKRASSEATLSALKEQMDDMKASIQEHFDMEPEKLADNMSIEPEQHDLSELETLRAQKEKLTRERDNIGPVNLRADTEAEELEKELTTLLNERNDLLQAIEELRGGIQKINKEARERLLAAFEHVNAHFSQLFVRLFGGGQAHLALIDSDDPLGAGLEIFAQPPGKTLQSLSLLSGGEQTLTSIALIFAMFLTNPSPICVLDEIDAPLDDANVDRVCDLLDEIAERGETRFLIITHHRLSMARMDRLYGVTMAERGVSQLVSVDLQQSFDFLEAA